MSSLTWIAGVAMIILCGCTYTSDSHRSEIQELPADADINQAKHLPLDNKILLAIGQDLYAVRGYVNSGLFPTPGAVTTYLVKIYDLCNPKADFGGLGIDNDLLVSEQYADWGSGFSSARISADENPDSALIIGLDISEASVENGLSRLAAGEFNKEIDKLAAFLLTINKPVYLRIGYEFDGAWNKGYDNTAHYKAAWRTIVDRLREKKVNHVAFVWQGASSPADESIEGYHEDIRQWYPGDQYVDWMGLSWFLLFDEYGSNPKSTRTQQQLADEIVNFARSRQKPVMIAEASPQGYFLEKRINANINDVIDGASGENIIAKTEQQIWREWYDPLLRYVYDNSDVIRALAYINCYWDQQAMWGPPYRQGLWGDSRIQVAPYITERWLMEINKPIWLHGSQNFSKHFNQQGSE